jgi:ABC-type glycerol-3-phosphate transport system substrate-binding protein
MKKVILALAIVSVSFAACNSGETKVTTETSKDTTTIVTAPTADTMKVVTDTTVKTTIKVDTLKK